MRRLTPLAADIRYASRVLRKSPAFTVVAFITLLLSIGANVVVFGVLNAVLLQPLAVHDPASLYQLRHKAWMKGRLLTTSYPAYEDFSWRNITFSGWAALNAYSTASPVASVPFAQSEESDGQVVVRSLRAPNEMSTALERTLSGMAANVSITVRSWPETLAGELFPARAAAVALGVMGTMAAMLGATGIVGMAAYSVSRRDPSWAWQVAWRPAACWLGLFIRQTRGTPWSWVALC